MRFQAFVEVSCTPASHNDGDNHKSERYDGEDRQCRSGWSVLFLALRVRGVHADELEDEIGEGAKVNNLKGRMVSISLA